MHETTYHRPSSVAEAAALFAKGSESKYLAGGHTRIPVMKQRLSSPSDVIDLGKIKDLIGIEPTDAGIMVKAATTHYDVANSGAVQKAIPALAHLASLIGDPAVRHRGTIGGPLANNDPPPDYPAAAMWRRPLSIRRRCWPSGQRSRPTSARSRRMISSRACSRQRLTTEKL